MKCASAILAAAILADVASAKKVADAVPDVPADDVPLAPAPTPAPLVCATGDGMIPNYDGTECVCERNHCVYTETWGACSATCGGGEKVATLEITQQPNACSQAAPYLESCPDQPDPAPCNTAPCPVDCVVSGWTVTEACTKSCNGGTKTLGRVITQDAAHGGEPCPDLTKTESCADHVCAGHIYVNDQYTECPMGTFQDKTAGKPSTCTPCPAGRYQDHVAQGDCKDCATGKYASSTTSTECTACDAGQYASTSAAITCTNCVQGTFSGAGQAACAACTPGKFAPAAGLSSCTDCAQGQYNTQSQRSGCSNCEGGKYQAVTGSTSCTLCQRGSAHNLEAQTSHTTCVDCAKGKYAEIDGSTSCEPCQSGSYADSEGTETCTACENWANRDTVERYFWTNNEAGWTIPCVKHPVNCALPTTAKPAFGTCSKSCRAAGTTSGIQSRNIKPAIHGWGGGVACSTYATLTGSEAAAGIRQGAFDVAKDEWTENRDCNDWPCPIDCETTPWTEWTPCTKTCTPTGSSAGRTQRTRQWIADPQHGGAECTHYHEEKDCNAHECEHAVCHTEYLKCTMEDWNSDEAKAVPNHGYGRTTKCNMANRIALRQEHCHHADAVEVSRNAANAGFTLHVEHNSSFSYVSGHSRFEIRDNYKCKYDRARLGNALTHGTPCECRCIVHPTGCYKAGYAFTDRTSIDANTFLAEDINTCSNACAQHPGCFLWEFNSVSKHCILKGKSSSVSYTPQANTFAGQTPSHRYSLTSPHILLEEGCIKAGQTDDKWVGECHPGTYTTKTRTVDGSYVVKCTKCPQGTYNPIPGRTYCMDIPTRPSGMSLQDWFATFEAN